MKTLQKIFIISFLSISTFAQQATEIDPKFVKLPQFADLAAISAAINTPTQGMMVYNVQTNSNWFFDGANWKDMLIAGSGGGITLPFSGLQADPNPLISLTNSGAGAAFKGSTTGTGFAGKFETNNALNTASTLQSITNGKGRAGHFETNNSVNGEDALFGYTLGTGNAIYGLTTGTGSAGRFQIGVQSNGADALNANTMGSGFAGKFTGTNAISAQGKTILNGEVGITNTNWLELGKGLEKQEDNGKIAYGAFGEANTLSIVGGGLEEDGSDRKVKIWANGGTEITGSISTNGEIKPNGQSGMPKTVLMNTGNGTMQWQDLIPKLSYEDLMLKAYPSVGDLAYDLTFKALKHYDGSKWVPLNSSNSNSPEGTAYDLGNGRGNAIQFDSFGNLYMTGEFSGTLTFGAFTLVSSGISDIFLAKFSSTLEPQWAVKAGGVEYDASNSLFVDANQNVFIAGGFSSVASFGPLSLTSNGEYDAFLAKYDAAGIPQWVQKAGSPSNDLAIKVKADNLGNIYLTGTFKTVLNLTLTTLTSNNNSLDVFIAKYDPSGTLLWAQKAGGNEFDNVRSMTVDQNNNVYICGKITGTASFAGTSVSTAGHEAAYVAKYLPNGSLVWVRIGEVSNYTSAYDVQVDADMNVYLVGFFQSSNITFGSTSYSSVGNSNGFLVKFNAAGTLQWFQQSTNSEPSGDSFFSNIALDTDGTLYVSGGFNGSVNIGGFTFHSLSNAYGDNFITKFNQDDQFWESGTKTNSSSFRQIQNLALDHNKNLFGTGYYSGRITFGNTTLNAGNATNIFLFRFN